MKLPSQLRGSILPDFWRSGVSLLLTWLAPQALLLTLNLRARWLVGGEMDQDQMWMMNGLLVAQVCLLLLGGVVVLLLRRGRLDWIVGLPLMVLHVAFLFMAFVFMSKRMLPQATSTWILPPQRVMFFQFALIMPMTFHAGALFSSFPRVMTRQMDVGFSLLASIVFPAFGYAVLFGIISSRVDLAGWLIGMVIIGWTVLSLLALVRFLTQAMAIACESTAGMVGLCVVIGLVTPLLGLSLNRMIPFPFNFQSVWVYGIVVLNGLLLVVPAVGRPWMRRVQWLGLCALFPYVLYFFLVFLPFLPLSLLAMLAMLSGLLMWAPTGLFLVQGLRIVQGFQEARQGLGTWAALGLGIGAFLILPASYTVRGMLHRQSLHEALAYVYESDPGDAAEFRGNRGMLRHSLVAMERSRKGVQLPFMTAYYNWMVFDGMALKDSKLQHLHQTFFGEKLEVGWADNIWDDFVPGMQMDWTGRTPRLQEPPSTAVDCTGIAWQESVAGGIRKVQAAVSMTYSKTDAGSRRGVREFVQRIEIPPEAVVSGFWLWVGKERVAGRIFEKSTAMWVYHMIRDTGPRDPGLLTYTSPTELELRVFPINPGETRKVEIEFSMPAGSGAGLRVGGEAAPAASLAGPRLVGSCLVAPAGGVTPLLERSPYLHAILDRSLHTEAPAREQLRRAGEIAREMGLSGLRVTLANYEAEALGWVDLSQIDTVVLPDFPARGGLLVDRMIARAYRQYERDAAADPGRWAARVPRVLVVRDDGVKALSWPGDLAAWTGLVPDEPGVWSCGMSEAAVWVPLRSGGVQPADRRVLLAQRDGVIRAGLARGETVGLRLVGEGPVEWWSGKGFHRIPGLEEEDAAAYGRAVELLEGDWRAERIPGDAARKERVVAARDLGVLTPATAFIVVENSAQWNILKLKEREKLDSQEGLDFMQASEPPLWVLLLLLGGWRWWWCRRRAG